MTTCRRLAVSYTRFSNPHQGEGNSTERQDTAYRDFCERHNLTPAKEVYADKGLSGYHDKHRTKGRLGDLIAAAQAGAFDPGTVIVVEAWDRLGRLRPDLQIELLKELLTTGVLIGVARMNEIFAITDFGTHKWISLAVFVQLAFDESKQKGERIAASWAGRRNRARQDPRRLIGHKRPGWIKFVDGRPQLIPERVAIVKRILRLAADGHGWVRIVGILTREKVPAFGERLLRPNRRQSEWTGGWTKTYIRKLIGDRRLLGEFQPRKMTEETRDGETVLVSKPDGPPIPGYYPAAVTEAELALAGRGQPRRRPDVDRKGRQSAPRDARHVNVFRDVLTHARDGERMHLHQVYHGPGKRSFALINNSGAEGRAGRCYTFPYTVFENRILAHLKELDPRTILPRPPGGPSAAQALRDQLEDVRRELAECKADLARPGHYSKHGMDVLRQIEARELAVANQLRDELERTAQPLSRTWDGLPTLIEQVREGGNEARLRLRPALRAITDAAHVLIVTRGAWRLCAVQFRFVGGAVRNWYLSYRPACNGRPLADVGDLSDKDPGAQLDFANPTDVAKIERFLEKILDGLVADPLAAAADEPAFTTGPSAE